MHWCGSRHHGLSTRIRQSRMWTWWWRVHCVHRRYYLFTVNLLNTGPDLVQAGSCSEKKCVGPSPGVASPCHPYLFSPEKKLTTFFGRKCGFYSFHSGLTHYFSACCYVAKNFPVLLWGLLLWGPLFGRTCLNPPLVEHAPDMWDTLSQLSLW